MPLTVKPPCRTGRRPAAANVETHPGGPSERRCRRNRVRVKLNAHGRFEKSSAQTYSCYWTFPLTPAFVTPMEALGGKSGEIFLEVPRIELPDQVAENGPLIYIE